MSLSSKLVQTLKQLSQLNASAPVTTVRSLSKEFFKAVYEIAITDCTFTSEEQSSVGKLLENSLPNLRSYLSWRVDEYDSHSGIIARYERSYLQFLLDNYKNFPASDGGKLEKYLTSIIDSDDLEQWDDFLSNYIDGEEDATIDKLSLEFSKIPKSHWWWFQ